MNQNKSAQVEPGWGKDRFNCPFCNTFAQQKWEYIRYVGESLIARNKVKIHIESPLALCQAYESLGMRTQGPIVEEDKISLVDANTNLQVWEGAVIKTNDSRSVIGVCKCDLCSNTSIWRADADEDGSNSVMIYPVSDLQVPPLTEGASDLVSELYSQAVAVYARSPIATLALLRMATETLCKELLKEKIKNKRVPLYSMINLMKQEFNLDESVIGALDFVRGKGNTASHEPGEIILDDKMNPEALFRFVHHAVEETITNKIKKEKIKRELEAEKAKTSKNNPSAIK